MYIKCIFYSWFV